MTLTGRLSTVFLAALGVILAGFGISLYLLTRVDLHRQVTDRLDAGLATLAAAVEREADGLEWEPGQRHLTLGHAGDELRWEVHDGAGQLVDRSPNLAVDDPWLVDASPGTATDAAGRPWLVAARRLEADSTFAAAGKHAALVLTTGICLDPVQTSLRRLAWTLAGLATVFWLATGVICRFVCRGALAPVRRMAAAARAMGAADLGERLPCPGSKDELDDLGGSFNDLLGRLHEAFERQRRFTGDASHQLRTPLAAMLGQLEVALRRERTPDDYREALTLAHSQAGQLRQIVESLLFLARADVEADGPALETVELTKWLAVYLANHASQPRHDDVVLDTPGQPVWVRVQPVLLEQLLDNLLDNAGKHGIPGRPIVLRLAREHDTAVLTVEDRGSGIAAEDLPFIFEPFYRSASARRRGLPGVGLGLAVAWRIAAAFGGTLTAESEPGQWARFTLRLPTAPSGSPTVPADVPAA